MEGYKNSENTFIILLLLAIPVLAYIYAAFMMSITGSINKINRGLKKIAEKDLTGKMQITSKDELGIVGVGFNHMVDNLKGTLHTISSTSSNVSTAVEQVNESIIRFDSNIKTISQTIENISGSTEELSAATEEIEATVNNLDEAALKMQEKARECFDIADHINGKTEITINKMEDAKANTENILAATEKELQKSLEALRR